MPVILILRRERSGGLRFKATWANSLRDLVSKKHTPQKSAGVVAQGVGPKFKP
jgi:hypothetical protein